MRKYKIVAYILDIIHYFVIAFILFGQLIPIGNPIRTFHDVFVILVLVSQVLVGINCPLTLLSYHLRKKDNPDYEVPYDSFILKFFKEKFGVSVNKCIIFLSLLIMGVIAISSILVVILPT